MKFAEFRTKISDVAIVVSRFRLFMQPEDYAVLASKIDLTTPNTVQCCLSTFGDAVTGHGAEEFLNADGSDWYLYEGQYLAGKRNGFGRMSY